MGTVIPPALSGNLNGVLLNTPSNPLTPLSLTNAMATLTLGNIGASSASPASLPVPSTAFATTTSTGGVPLTGVTANSSIASPTAATTAAKPATTTPTTTGLAATPTTTTPATTATVTAPATTPTTPATVSSGTGSAAGGMNDIIALIATTIVLLLQAMGGGSAGAGAGSGTGGSTGTAPSGSGTTTLANAPTGLAAAPAAANSNVATTSAALDKLIIGGTAQQKADLKQNLLAISQDPEGGKLVSESIRRGVTFNVGDPAKAGGANDVDASSACPICAQAAKDAQFAATGTSGNVVINGVTITKNNGSSDITVANPNKLDTIVHEMIHATTTADGNSQQEEATAKFIGSRVAGRLTGQTPTQNFNAVLQNTIPLYQGLQRSNNIAQSLAGLGLTV